MEACREWPSSGLPLGLSGVKVGDDGWKDRRRGEGLKHCAITTATASPR